MKKLLILSILLLFVSGSQAHMGVIHIGGGVPSGGVACDSTNDSELYNSSWGDADNERTASDATYQATKITLSNQSDITGYYTRAYDGGSGLTFYVEIWSHDSGDDEPNALQSADLTASVDADTLNQSTLTDEEMLLDSTYEGLASGTYWVVHRASGSYCRVSRDTSEAGERYCESTDSGSTWGCQADRSIRTKVLGCE